VHFSTSLFATFPTFLFYHLHSNLTARKTATKRYRDSHRNKLRAKGRSYYYENKENIAKKQSSEEAKRKRHESYRCRKEKQNNSIEPL